MQIMLMNINKVDVKSEFLIVPKGMKFMGSGKLGLNLDGIRRFIIIMIVSYITQNHGVDIFMANF